jgi:imidazolonepropionase-like amidohydrolase
MALTRRLVTLAVVAVTVFSTAVSGSAHTGVQRGMLVRADRLFDGRAFHMPGSVLIDGGTIVAVDPSRSVAAARRIDLGDATILPGLIDLHVHGEGTATLRGGVTSVRNLGEPVSSLRPPFDWHGLRILAAGPLVSVAGGYPEPVWGPTIALDVKSPASARAAVDMLSRRGAAVIKIALDSNHGQWPILTLPEVRAILAEAHRRGLRVTAHAMWPDGVARALAGGVDELAHTPCGATDSMMRQISVRHIPVVATMHVEQLAYGGCVHVASQIVKLGGTLLYGSDVGNRGIPNGIDTTELRLMRSAGLTPVQVLAAATSRAGAELGLAKLGTLAPHAPADLIAVRGDARKLNPSMAKPLLVISGGRVRVGPTR